MENNRPFEILSPYERWVPTKEQPVQSDYEKLLPPLVHKTREANQVPAYSEFVEELKTEGVDFQYRPMGHPDKSRNPIIVEVDRENPKKDLELIDVEKIQIRPFPFKTFNENELKEIVFKNIDDKFSHAPEFSDILPDYRDVIAFFARNILKESRTKGREDPDDLRKIERLKQWCKDINELGR